MDNALIDQLLEEMIGGGAPAAYDVSPRLTNRSQDLPGQQYDKVKKSLKANPQDPMAAGMTGDPLAGGGGSNVQAELLSMIMGEPMPAAPVMKATKAGAPMAANASLMSQVLAQVLGMTGKDERPDKDDKTPYVDDEDE